MYKGKTVKVIAAMDYEGIIGIDGDIPWYLPNDLKFFNIVTNGCPIVMGRVTYDTIPNKFKPFRNRDTFVITRDKNQFENEKGVTYVNSMSEAFNMIPNDEKDVFIAGGGQIYQMSTDIADEYYITLVDRNIDTSQSGKVVKFPESVNFNNSNEYKQIFEAESKRGTFNHIFKIYKKNKQ